MQGTGYKLPKNMHSLQQAKHGVNPKTGATWYIDKKGLLWSWDRGENNFNVLTQSGFYYRITPEGIVIDRKTSTIPFPH